MKEIKRDQKIDLRLTAKEKKEIKEAAAAMGMSASEFIRLACQRLMNKKERD